MRLIFSPRLWLLIWLGIGSAGLLYAILSASLSGGARNSAVREAAVLNDPSLLVGEMEDFAYAFTPRTAPTESFLHDRREMTLADFQGKTVLVNFWATWCAPCLKELPSLDALQEALGSEQFAVVAVAADPKGPDVAAAFLKKLDIRHLKLYADPKLALTIATGGAAVLPVSILYDASGREVGRLTGEADWTSMEAKALIEAAIASSDG